MVIEARRRFFVSLMVVRARLEAGGPHHTSKVATALDLKIRLELSPPTEPNAQKVGSSTDPA